MTHLDGNSLAGALADVFAFDMTAATARCRTCGVIDVLARAMVYPSPAGTVVRCAACGEVLATLVDAGDRLFLGFSGVTAIEVPKTAG
ncbi:DUF6510 family protein [Agromyces sp. MMS24-JH15]|uniref:DUF6510 family protein n=1 Tax=Agromyces sp. MMS24-JH15 TaxID=3243765 RepID=UPI0037491480